MVAVLFFGVGGVPTAAATFVFEQLRSELLALVQHFATNHFFERCVVVQVDSWRSC
jgi:hypothetical protein